MLRQSFIFLIVLLFFTSPFYLTSCKKDSKGGIDLKFDRETVPTVNSDSVTVLISDSGIIKYKAVTKTWEMYEGLKNEYSYFPDGVYLEQFDTLFNVVMSVEADTAWNYSNKKLWKLRGNVFIKNHQSLDTYSSPEFYWDQQERIVYSDSVVTIDSPEGGLINASRFRSDEAMNNAVFVALGELSSRGKGLIYVSEDKENKEEDDDEISEENKE